MKISFKIASLFVLSIFISVGMVVQADAAWPEKKPVTVAT